MAGSRKNFRAIDGILLLDKPEGLSSNQALQRVRRLYQARKAGHTGSLDPLATGLLPVCLGEGTKISGFLLDADKRYRVRCRLGVTTTTGDSEGETLRTRPVPAVDGVALERAMAALRGPIDQVPPMYSALKHNGERLYKLARQGLEVERKARPVIIHAFDLIARDGEDLTLDVHCSKGTYVRTLVEDLGELLGCGGHVTMLRRTALGPFEQPAMTTLDSLAELAAAGGLAALDDRLLPVEAGLSRWPDVRLQEDAAHYILQGQAVRVPAAPDTGMVRLFGPDRFLGMGIMLDDGRVAPKRLLREQKNP
ncbi:MAG: tRNA pseudouridine(55) synthase TruB [Aquisalimonadaceae bacterium]